MSSAIVWFNGPSVKQFYNIPPHPLEVGCNFILDNRKVHHICAYDQQVIKILTKQRTNKNFNDITFWTRKIFSQPDWRRTKKYPSYCSGTLALTVAYELGIKKCTLLGCDWLLTNASTYDEQYVWRKFQPKKHSADKTRILTDLSRLMEITIVHTDHKRPFGPQVKWITPVEFMEGHTYKYST